MFEDLEAQALATLLPPNGHPRPYWLDQAHSICRQWHEESRLGEWEGM